MPLSSDTIKAVEPLIQEIKGPDGKVKYRCSLCLEEITQKFVMNRHISSAHPNYRDAAARAPPGTLFKLGRYGQSTPIAPQADPEPSGSSSQPTGSAASPVIDLPRDSSIDDILSLKIKSETIAEKLVRGFKETQTFFCTLCSPGSTYKHERKANVLDHIYTDHEADVKAVREAESKKKKEEEKRKKTAINAVAPNGSTQQGPKSGSKLPVTGENPVEKPARPASPVKPPQSARRTGDPQLNTQNPNKVRPISRNPGSDIADKTSTNAKLANDMKGQALGQASSSRSTNISPDKDAASLPTFHTSKGTITPKKQLPTSEAMKSPSPRKETSSPVPFSSRSPTAAKAPLLPTPPPSVRLSSGKDGFSSQSSTKDTSPSPPKRAPVATTAPPTIRPVYQAAVKVAPTVPPIAQVPAVMPAKKAVEVARPRPIATVAPLPFRAREGGVDSRKSLASSPLDAKSTGVLHKDCVHVDQPVVVPPLPTLPVCSGPNLVTESVSVAKSQPINLGSHLNTRNFTHEKGESNGNILSNDTGAKSILHPVVQVETSITPVQTNTVHIPCTSLQSLTPTNSAHIASPGPIAMVAINPNNAVAADSSQSDVHAVMPAESDDNGENILGEDNFGFDIPMEVQENDEEVLTLPDIIDLTAEELDHLRIASESSGIPLQELLSHFTLELRDECERDVEIMCDILGM